MSKKKRILTEEEKNKIKLAKKELNSYKKDDNYIKDKLDDIEETRTLLEKVTATLEPGKTFTTGASKDKFADGISKINELSKKCRKRLQEHIENKIIIDEKIDMLPYPYREVLFYRYTKSMKWLDVADKVNYERDYVCDELHPEALYLYSKL